VEKSGGAREAIDDNTIRHMRFACWISKATQTHTNAPRDSVKHALPLFFSCMWIVPTCFTAVCKHKIILKIRAVIHDL
jgi:hypothetical protein